MYIYIFYLVSLGSCPDVHIERDEEKVEKRDMLILINTFFFSNDAVHPTLPNALTALSLSLPSSLKCKQNQNVKVTLNKKKNMQKDGVNKEKREEFFGYLLFFFIFSSLLVTNKWMDT
ncbi:hypothetical protein HMI56_003406 [Coelomomyces lativittatus]|nr:hypothetical protein HMI56_003406 [Coelomomyces lativittatus]